MCIYIFLLRRKIKVEKELLILIPQPRTSDASNDCQEQSTHRAQPRNLIVFLLFNIYGPQCALVLPGLFTEPCLESSVSKVMATHVKG